VAFARLSPSVNRCFRSLLSAQGPMSLLQVSSYLRCTQIIIRKEATVTPEANALNVAVSLLVPKRLPLPGGSDVIQSLQMQCAKKKQGCALTETWLLDRRLQAICEQRPGRLRR
jgi:hypothetical protein